MPTASPSSRVGGAGGGAWVGRVSQFLAPGEGSGGGGWVGGGMARTGSGVDDLQDTARRIR